MAGQTLLVVDDDEPVVEFLRESLASQGFEVATDTSPEAALRRLEAEPFDLVITDLQMPGMRGTDMLSAILRRRPDQLVLLMTAFGSIDLAVAAVRAGACDFIANAPRTCREKSFSPRGLRQLVRDRLRQNPAQ